MCHFLPIFWQLSSLADGIWYAKTPKIIGRQDQILEMKYLAAHQVLKLVAQAID
jgi:hypothetical protein